MVNRFYLFVTPYLLSTCACACGYTVVQYKYSHGLMLKCSGYYYNGYNMQMPHVLTIGWGEVQIL